MAVVDVEFRANANFSGLISQANMANAAISKLQASVTSLNAEQINQAFSQFSKGLTGSGQYIAQTVRVSDATQRFGQDLVNNKLQLKDYAREFGNYVTGRESQIKKLADQQVRMQKSMVVTRGTDSTGRLVAQVFTPTGLSNDLETNAMRATSRIQVMNEFLHKASTSVVNWGKNTQWAGRQMTVGLTVPLSMLATATGKAFYELDTQLVQMQKVYGTGIKGVGDEAIASIRSQVTQLSQELAKAYGIPVAQTAALAAEIAQAGKTGNELLSSVEQTTKLATLGEIDRQDAMKATLSIQSTFNQNTKELGESINFLNAVENSTNVSLQDLVTGIPKAGPVVKALGGDIKDLSLMMVAMKEGGIPASEAANAIKSSLASLINPTQKVSEKMKTFGIDLTAIVDKNAGKLMPTLMEFRGELDKLDALSRQRILEELFGKFQFARVNALFNNLGRAGSQTVEVMKLMGLSTAELAGIADKELKTMAESASGRFKRLWATVQGDLAVAGQGILNAGSMILSVIDKIINGFEKLPDGLKKFLGGTALLAAIIGPIIMTIGVLGNFFGYIMKGLALMRSFGRRGAGDFQLMTAETIATANAGSMLENTLFDQAKAADVMSSSIQRLINTLTQLNNVQTAASQTATSSLSTPIGREMAARVAAQAVGGANEVAGGHIVAKATLQSGDFLTDKKGKPLQVQGKNGSGPAANISGNLFAIDKTVNDYLSDVDITLGDIRSGLSDTQLKSVEARAKKKGVTVDWDKLDKSFVEMVSANEAFEEVFVKQEGMARTKAAKAIAQLRKAAAGGASMDELYLILEKEGIQKPKEILDQFFKRTVDIARQKNIELQALATLSPQQLSDTFSRVLETAKTNYNPGQSKISSKAFGDSMQREYNKIDDLAAMGVDERIVSAMRRRLITTLDQIKAGGGQTLTTSTGGSRSTGKWAGSDLLSLFTGAGGAEDFVSLEQQITNPPAPVNTQAQIKKEITRLFAIRQQQAKALGIHLDDINEAMRSILKDVNLTMEQKLEQLQNFDIANVNAAPTGPPIPTGMTAAERGAKVQRGMMGVGMAASIGGSLLPAGAAGNLITGVGVATSISSIIPAEAFTRTFEKFDELKGKFDLVKDASGAMGKIGALAMNPVVLGLVAVGAAAFMVYKNLKKSAQQSRDWLASTRKDAEVLGYKYQEINFQTKSMVESTDKARKSVESLTESIQSAPESNPLKKMSEDFKNDADSSDTVRKAVAFFQLQIARGVSASTAREQLTAVLTAAGQEVLIPEINVKIGQINVDDTAGNLAGAMAQAFKDAERKGFERETEPIPLAIQGLVAGVGTITDALLMRQETEATSNAYKTLAEDIERANNAYDEVAMRNLATAFGQIVQEQAKLDPTKFQEFVSGLSNDELLMSIASSKTGIEELTTSFISASGQEIAYEGIAAQIASIQDPAAKVAALADLVAINMFKIVPAASAAGRAAQVSMMQTANAATAAAEAAAGRFAASAVKKPSTGGSSGGGKTTDPYKGQKDANQKRIDQEKDIIKAIEKKRDAEKKAFDEKKKQDEFLNKQADLQIGYREALATGDFAAAARVKNEILAEQARKRAEDAQKNKDDAYQKEIDSRQVKVGNLEDVGKKLDALSQKAKETSVATSQAATDSYNTNVTTATTTMTTLIDKQKEHNYGTVEEFKKDNPKLVAQLTDIEVDVDEFFTRAFRIGNENIKANITDLEGVNTDVKNSLTGLLLGVGGIVKLGGWIQDKTDAGTPPTNEQILARAKLLKEEQEGLVSITPWGHQGGPIEDGMKSTKTPKKISSLMRSDDMMMVAQKGEYMISAAAAGIIGRGNLDAINNGKLPAVPVSGGSSGSNYNFTVNAAPGQDAKQIAQEVQRIFQINERRKGGART